MSRILLHRDVIGGGLVYLAADPDARGGGVGGRLLAHVDELARSAGRSELSLWVIDDNARALAVYERAGWVRTDELKQAGGRRERRLVRRLSG
ncbi:GNAT family N-acetyltransferase [Actinoplanes missouriensis]|uniref:GNAT family N-acetyltransferase n=1 Tax=Actinoplanes missouriensis TaxID=1866 RepID=UPI0033FCCA80